MNPKLGLRSLLTGAAVLVMLLSACSPALDWREVAVDGAPLHLLMPCKPDHAMRQLEMGSRTLEMQMLGCEAGRGTFTLAYATLPQGVPPSEVLARWQAASAMRLGAATPSSQEFVPRGGLAVPGSARMSLQGRNPQGAAVAAQMAWFAHSSASGIQVFQAAAYAASLTPDALDTLLESLRWQ